MKNKVKLILISAIAALSLFGCGGANNETKTSFTPTPTDSKEASAADLDKDYVVVLITYIGSTYFKAEAPWQDSIKYIIHAELDEDYCVGDYVEVVYEDIYELEENQYEIDALSVSASNYIAEDDTDYKPVIYLYPPKETTVNVKLDYDGKLVATAPKYDNGWTVTAKPDGTLITKEGDTYKYLFWEGQRDMSYNMEEGFCVKGKNTEQFLKEKLSYLGLNENETNEFIHFWLPYMKDNPYNLISFQGNSYTDHARLAITPTPDSILRVYMVFTPLKESVNVKEQTLPQFTRKGFTVVEWGGTIQ